MGGVMGDESRLSSRNANLEDGKAICLQSPNGEVRNGGDASKNDGGGPGDEQLYLPGILAYVHEKDCVIGRLAVGNTSVSGRRAPAWEAATELREAGWGR